MKFKNENKMTKVIETKFGEVTLKDVMLDLDGTNLESGISLSFDEDLFAEISGYSTENFGNEKEDLILLEELIGESL